MKPIESQPELSLDELQTEIEAWEEWEEANDDYIESHAKEIDRLKANTDNLPLTDQEKSIIKWLGDQDIWTIEAINGIIEKAKQNK